MTEPCEIPWPVLERMVGEAFREFMFLGEVNGVLLFKHVWTRRYLNVDRDGHTYRYAGGRYERMPLAEALCHVLN